MGLDLVGGERNLLLIGNQGVGKNKLADRMLQLLRREREYVTCMIIWCGMICHGSLISGPTRS